MCVWSVHRAMLCVHVLLCRTHVCVDVEGSGMCYGDTHCTCTQTHGMTHAYHASCSRTHASVSNTTHTRTHATHTHTHTHTHTYTRNTQYTHTHAHIHTHTRNTYTQYTHTTHIHTHGRCCTRCAEPCVTCPCVALHLFVCAVCTAVLCVPMQSPVCTLMYPLPIPLHNRITHRQLM